MYRDFGEGFMLSDEQVRACHIINIIFQFGFRSLLE